MKLVLLRHGESQWNLENRFTGWTDVPLSPKGEEEAKNAGVILKQNGYDFDICYTSYLKRAINTLNYALKSMDREWLPVIKSWKLNERHYGALQGLNKSETAEKYGADQVKIWRRSYDVQPPMLAADDKRNPALQDAYRDVCKKCLPLGECLEDTVKRTVPYFNEEILPQMKAGKRVLIAAHGNSLRALVMYLEKMTPEQIMEVNIPTGVPLVYELDDKTLEVIKKEYIGDADLIAKKIKSVAAQGTAKK